MARAEKRKRDRAILEYLSTCGSFSFLPDRHHHGLRKNLTSPSGVTEMCADRGLLSLEICGCLYKEMTFTTMTFETISYYLHVPSPRAS